MTFLKFPRIVYKCSPTLLGIFVYFIFGLNIEEEETRRNKNKLLGPFVSLAVKNAKTDNCNFD